MLKQHSNELKKCKRLIIRFGWAKYWGGNKFFENYPYLSEEAARYLLSHEIKLIGCDTPQLDSANNIGSPIHKILLNEKIILVEYLANLDNIHILNGWKLIALPLKITGADGSPSRVCLYKDGTE